MLFVADGVLMYYKDETDAAAHKKPQGTINVFGAGVLVQDEGEGGMFTVHTLSRALTLRAPDAEHLGQREVDTWVETLIAAGAHELSEPPEPPPPEPSGLTAALAHLHARVVGSTAEKAPPVRASSIQHHPSGKAARRRGRFRS